MGEMVFTRKLARSQKSRRSGSPPGKPAIKRHTVVSSSDSESSELPKFDGDECRKIEEELGRLLTSDLEEHDRKGELANRALFLDTYHHSRPTLSYTMGPVLAFANHSIREVIQSAHSSTFLTDTMSRPAGNRYSMK